MSDFLNSRDEKKKRIVVFAGVFDPVHKGHISAAEESLYYADKVVFLAERTPMHKKMTTAYEHRLNMLKIATLTNSHFEVIDYPHEHHWIFETFTWLKEKYPNHTFAWLVGGDVAPLIDKWPDSEKLRELNVEVILQIKREGLDDAYIKRVHDTPVIHLIRPLKKHEKVSSTKIRSNITHSQSSLPKGVWDYIQKNKLYPH